jgi:hypothetical protein
MIATIIFYYSKLENEIHSNNIYVIIDRFVFIGLFAIYIIIHISFFIWLIFVPYRRRREMEYLDREYVAKKHIQLNSRQSHLDFRRSSSIMEFSPTMKAIRPMRRSEGIIIIPNGTTFIPIQEGTNETTGKTIDTVELREQDGDNKLL